jgi:hypothetical protein
MKWDIWHYTQLVAWQSLSRETTSFRLITNCPIITGGGTPPFRILNFPTPLAIDQKIFMVTKQICFTILTVLSIALMHFFILETLFKSPTTVTEIGHHDSPNLNNVDLQSQSAFVNHKSHAWTRASPDSLNFLCLVHRVCANSMHYLTLTTEPTSSLGHCKFMSRILHSTIPKTFGQKISRTSMIINTLVQGTF